MALIVGNDGSNTLLGTSGNDVIYGFDPNGPTSNVSSISATRVASGLSSPLFAGAPAGDPNRLFIVEQTGRIKILDLTTNQIAATPFLNVSGQILTDGERGLLGLAFDPNFSQNGYIYVNLINLSGDTEIRRYQVSASNPNQIDPGTATLIITIDQPNASNHKAGWLDFGKDGYLYIPLGDGGGGGSHAQDVNSLLGKVLRLDVSSDAFPADPTRNYAIPSDNPFVGIAGADEIWALGLRNPFRDSFDRGLGTLFIADVGQNTWEEIDIGASGANYGWPRFEGPAEPSPGIMLGGGTLTAPIHSYDRSVGNVVTGGYVYRGESDGLQGHYFFADFGQGKIFTLQFNGTNWAATERTAQISTNTGAINLPSSFGEDGFGNLYVVDYLGEVFSLIPNLVSADQADTLTGNGGNDMLYGGGGDDLLDGGAGADVIYGGTGIDTAVYSGEKEDYSFTDLGTLQVRIADLRSGAPDGIDVDLNVEFFRFSNGTFDFASLFSGSGTPGIIVVGTAGNDTLTGTNNDDFITGLAGNDILIGLGGIDIQTGGAGDDTVFGGQGADNLLGDAGNDVLAGDDGNDILQGGADNDFLYGGLGNDQPYGGSGNDSVSGGDGNDIIVLEDGNDTGLGDAGNDYIYAGNGNDSLFGGAGYDVLLGEAGNDFLFGGGAQGTADYLFGGTGTDVFVVENLAGATVVQDFTRAEADLISLQGTGFASFAEVLAVTSDFGSFCVITVNANSNIWVIGQSSGTLQATDFAFS